MPELPEVETIRLSLEKKILGLSIKEIQILNPKSFLGNQKIIKGAKVIKVWRRAKVLGIDLGSFGTRHAELVSASSKLKKIPNTLASLGTGQVRDDKLLTLLFHLKMSGQIIFEGKEKFVGGHPTKDMLGSMPNKHTRVIFEFSDESKLYFNDQRKFGWIKIVKSDELKNLNYGYKVKLGPEPLGKEFTLELFKSLIISHPSQPVKVAILDPSVVAGVGNIYACEALFLAKIDPRIRVRDLSNEQIQNLHKSIIEVLENGIKYGGSTRTHFVDSDGKKGLFLDYANVYNRSGKPCKVCGTKIEKIKLGGRGTFFCSVCQQVGG